MEWLSDRALNAFGRHTAPVVRLPDELQADEHVVLIHGGFPNKRGHVLVQDCMGIRIQDGKVVEQLAWPDLQARLALRPGQLRNLGQEGEVENLRALLPIAVDAANARLQALKATFEADRKETLNAQRQRLAQLKGKHENQLQLVLMRSEQAETIKAKRREERQEQIDRMFRDHEDWLDNTQTTEDIPYLQVAAVFTGNAAQLEESS